jgi:hypothetical protein
MNESIRALLLLYVVNAAGFCLLLRNCDFSVSSENTMLFVIGGLFFKIYILLTKYDAAVEV